MSHRHPQPELIFSPAMAITKLSFCRPQSGQKKGGNTFDKYQIQLCAAHICDALHIKEARYAADCRASLDVREAWECASPCGALNKYDVFGRYR